MKRIFLIVIALMAFGVTNAQKTRFGIKGGLNITTLTGDIDANSLVGFQIGGFAEINVIERLAIQPELLFSTQGADLQYIGGSRNPDLKLNYINIPVLAKFYITKKFTVEGGPQLGFLVSAKFDSNDVKDSYRSVDTGFNFGAGYNFTDNLSAGIRYTVGISNVEKSTNDSVEDYLDYSVRNNVFALSLAYKF